MKQSQKVNQSFKFLILSSAAVVVSACGQLHNSPDPDYDQLLQQSQPASKPFAQPTPQQVVKTEDRVLIKGNVIEITTEGSLSFVEGAASSFEVKARVPQFQMNYELVFSGLPQDAIVAKQALGDYKVTWTPKSGFVGQKDNAKVDFQVELKQASQLSPKAQEIFDKLTKTQSFEIVVNRTKENPTVEKVTGLDGVVNEGSKVKFTVEVRDPGAQGTQAPKVTIAKDTEATQETVGVDGAAYITQDPDQAPSTPSPGIWDFHFIYDTESKPAPRPSKLAAGNKKLAADEIPVRFSVEILSPSQRTTSTTREFRLKYNSENQAPQFVVAQGDALSADIGTTVQIDIKVSSKVAGSQVTVAANDAQILLNQTLPGGSNANAFRCKDNGSSEVTCRLAWKVPCDDSLVGSAPKLTVKAVNSIGAIGVEGTLDRSISITKTKECTAAHPTAGGKK